MENLAGYALEVNIGGGYALEANIGGGYALEANIGGVSMLPGADGKSAYQYAVEGGYTGTEAEFAAKLAEELPDKLPNPNALTFTGAVTGSYDGSEALTVEIPSGGGGGGVQPDWNQNDDTQPDYVKNRPFYTGNHVETVLVEESTVSFADSGGIYMAEFPSTFAPAVEETYIVYWNGDAYECTCAILNGIPYLGNLSLLGKGSDTGEPFIMVVYIGQGLAIVTADTSTSHTFSISGFAEDVVKIDEKYLPKMNVSAFTNDAGYLTLDTLPKYGGESV